MTIAFDPSDSGRFHRLGAWCKRHPLKSLAILALLLAALGGAAYAAWSVQFSGTGRGDASGVPQLVTLTPIESTQKAAPGTLAGLGFSATNPNSYVVHLDSVSLSAGSLASSNQGICPVANWSLNKTNITGLDITIPPGVSTDVQIPDVFMLNSNASENCENTWVTVAVTGVGATG